MSPSSSAVSSSRNDAVPSGRASLPGAFTTYVVMPGVVMPDTAAAPFAASGAKPSQVTRPTASESWRW